MNNTGDILDYSRRLLNDPNEGVWTDQELLIYANECLCELIADTHYLEDYRDYVLESGTYLYDRDEQAVSIERVQYNGKYIPSIEVGELADWNINWKYDTGEVKRWFAFGNYQIGYSLIPSWTVTLSSFDSEYGLIIGSSYTAVTVTFDSEYGIVIDMDSDTGSDAIFFTPDMALGEIAYVDENAWCVNHRIVKHPEVLINDSDRPEVPYWFYRMLVFYICWRALKRDSPARDEKLARFYNGMYEDCLRTFKLFYKKGHKPKGHFDGVKPMTRTARERFFIGGRYYG
jgi:hypothetical protein